MDKFTKKVENKKFNENDYYKIYFDTEFTGLVKNTDLISIGMVTDDGDSFYAEYEDYDRSKLDDWLKDNIISNLYLKSEKLTQEGNSIIYETKGDSKFIKSRLEKWLKEIINREGKKLLFISDLLIYDWVLFNDIWNGSMNLPDYIYYIPIDICGMFINKKIDPDINREDFIKESIKELQIKKHNALWDAIVIKKCYEKLKN